MINTKMASLCCIEDERTPIAYIGINSSGDSVGAELKKLQCVLGRRDDVNFTTINVKSFEC